MVDLYFLDPDTPMMTFSSDFLCFPSEGGRQIPLFIAAPLMILRDADESFICRLAGRPAFTPTPENDRCDVCRDVRWLMIHCRTFDECKQRFCDKDGTYIFEVFKEVLSRLKKKPITYSRAHYEHSRYAPFHKALVNCPKADQIEKQIDMVAFNAFNKMEAYYVINDTKILDIYVDTFYCIMTTLIQILRRYVSKMTDYSAKSVDDETFMVLALNLHPTEVSRGFNALASSLAPSLIELKHYYFYERKNMMKILLSDEVELMLKNTMLCLKNLFVCNSTRPYDRNQEARLREEYMADPEVKNFIRDSGQL